MATESQGALAQQSGSASCGRPPVYGQPTSDPVRLALWAGSPSIAFEPPDPPAVPPQDDP